MSSLGCPFCAVVAGEDLSVREIYRDDHTVAFFPLEPATHGHTLVIPTRHVPDVWGLLETELSPLARTTMKVAQAIRTALAPEGLNIIQSNGRAATQTVEHLHIHLVPRGHADRMPEIWPAGTDETDRTLDQAALDIGAALTRSHLNVSAEDRRQHLAFIQSVVARMSQASSTAKAWLLPIVTAAYGFAVTKDAPLTALLGVLAVLIFGVLDANYLKQERAFRTLYDRVARGGDIPAFSMNVSLAATEATQSNYWPDRRDLWSWAVAPVYGPLLVAGVAIAVLCQWVW
ncbi:HIT family protein [Nocardia sp. NBC_01009]|uniref:HIT family protein n=1 Tax=Nocardia sp. NBC_01009 TaxID=2975996 RepID=UPI00386B87F7|nr:HIT domain-containing protein [Nocardia sp. NBC_01009]